VIKLSLRRSQPLSTTFQGRETGVSYGALGLGIASLPVSAKIIPGTLVVPGAGTKIGARRLHE
jgi:hypothetical protein